MNRFVVIGFLFAALAATPQVSGQAQGFTPTSGVDLLDSNTVAVGVEALFNTAGAPVTSVFNFSVPANRKMIALEGTVSYKGNCFAESLATVNVGGKAYPIKLKLGPGGGSTTLFIRYSIPLAYSSGAGQITLANGQVCTTDMQPQNRTTWEFQGVLRLQ